MRAGKGYCLAEVTVRGREGHSAYPHLGRVGHHARRAPRHRIEAVAEELKELVARGVRPAAHDAQRRAHRGGTAKNIIAGECRFTLEWRPVPGQEPGLVAELVRREVEAPARTRTKDFDCEVSVTRLDGGAETRADAPLVNALWKS